MRVASSVFTILMCLAGLSGMSQVHAATYTEDTVGPVELTRERGKPRTDELAVGVPYPLEHSEYTLILENRTTDGYWDDFMEWLGEQGVDIGPDRRPVPVQVALNGDRLARPTLIKDVEELPLDLVDGGNTIRLRLIGKPGDKLRARVRVVVTDNEMPVIDALVAPLANAAGWHGTEPTVSFECSDQITGIEFCSEPVTLAEGADQGVTGTARDKAGNESTASVTLDVDLTAPVLDLTLTPAPNQAGWQNQAVTADFTCTDNLSGVVGCPVSATYETEQAEHRIDETIQDAAGHTALTTATFGIDLTAPTLDAAVAPAANANGWHNQSATVSYSCADALSGIVQCPADQTVSQDGAGIAVTTSVADHAGNTTPVETLINLDQVAPTFDATVTPAANADGWHREPVLISYSCADELSGVVACPTDESISQDGQGIAVPADIVDKAGNAASLETTINLDQAAPTIQASVTPAANDAGWHAEPVTISYSCSDALSGVALCPVDDTVSQDGQAIAVAATVRDKAGNEETVNTEISLDQTAPVLALTAPADGESLASSTPALTFSVDDLAPEASTATLSTSGGAIGADCTLDADALTCQVTEDLGTDPVDITLALSDLAGNEGTVTASLAFDLDQDGVQAHLDQCPATPADETANADGCSPSQLDDDGDGVADSEDQCAATPEGVEVDETGCPTFADADGDGIEDEVDQCSGTEQGRDVDGNGCSAWQLDSDDDGVSDALDQCQETQFGLETGSDGCHEEERDTDGDGTPDLSDAFPEDPEKTALPLLTIDSPETLITVGSSPISVSGQVADNAQSLTVNGTEVAFEDGQWQASVHLEEGHNTVQARMVDAAGLVTTASIAVSLDLTPPELTIESHTDGQIVYSQPVVITGLVNDIVRGTVEATEAVVEVNGVTADILNRSYMASGITLEPGDNTITIRGTDQAGNVAEETITLEYQKPTGKHLQIIGGQNQTEIITGTLDTPLAVKVIGDDGNPVSDKTVVFRVIQGAGLVGAGTDLEGRGFVGATNAEGVAQTRFKLGRRVGVGNHKVRARVVGYDDEVVFHATAEGSTADKLSVNSGNNQRGGVFQRLPSPFVVVATDLGANVVEGARVEFSVNRGGGKFSNGEDSIAAVTDGDGRASAHLTLGGKLGLDQQRVTAKLLDGPEGRMITAGFTASGFQPGPAGETSISGVVVDNQDNPLPGVTVRVEGTSRKAVADEEGQFTIAEVPVGPVHLIADGSTAEAEGEYPDLAYNLTTVSGVNNPLRAPIYMVKLNPETKVWAGEEDVSVTIDEVPGFKLDIPAGSVTFPDGSRKGFVSVTAVNANHVPMAPPNGMQPQFIVTIQPTGAKFDPPARLTLPNVDGHQPGAQVEMYSFDHDLEEFVSIGLGTVSEDGTEIQSNPGVGVVKAGWHCGSQPSGSGSCCSKNKAKCPGECEKPAKCEGCEPVEDPENKKLQQQVSEKDCKVDTCAGTKPDPGQKPDDEPNDCHAPDCVGPDKDDPDPKGKEDMDDHNECQECVRPEDGGPPAPEPVNEGNECEDGCGVCKEGECDVDDDKKKPPEQQDPRDCKTLLCGPGENGKDWVPKDELLFDENIFDCNSPVCKEGQRDEEPDLSDHQKYCAECERNGDRGELKKKDDNVSCYDGTNDKDGDCGSPGCKNGFCQPAQIPDKGDEPDDDDSNDCFEPVCRVDGNFSYATKEKIIGHVINESGHCFECTESGRQPSCTEIFSAKEKYLRDSRSKNISDCKGELSAPAPVPPDPHPIIAVLDILTTVSVEGSKHMICVTWVDHDAGVQYSEAINEYVECYDACK